MIRVAQVTVLTVKQTVDTFLKAATVDILDRLGGVTIKGATVL
jgi:hypothetical protein